MTISDVFIDPWFEYGPDVNQKEEGSIEILMLKFKNQ